MAAMPNDLTLKDLMPIFLEVFCHELLILRRSYAKLLSGFVFFVMFETVFFLLLQQDFLGIFNRDFDGNFNKEVAAIGKEVLVDEAQQNKAFASQAFQKIEDLNWADSLNQKAAKSDALQASQNSELEKISAEASFIASSMIQAMSFLASGTIFAILTSLLVYFGEFLRRDHEDGSLEQLSLICQNFELVILAKLLANWLCSCFAIIIFGGIFAFAQSGSFIAALQFSTVIALMSLALSAICAFCGSISVFCNSLSLVAIIALPLTIPPILISQLAITESFSTNCPLLVAIMLINIACSIFGSAKLARL